MKLLEKIRILEINQIFFSLLPTLHKIEQEGTNYLKPISITSKHVINLNLEKIVKYTY